MAAVLLLGGCEELKPKEIQTFETRGKGEYTGFAGVPEEYAEAAAKADGCVVYKDAGLVSGREYWDAFAEQVQNKEPAKVRIMQRFGQNDDYFLEDILYDGRRFRLVVSDNPKEFDYEFKYMVDVEGRPDTDVRPMRYVVLTNRKELSFEDIWNYEHAKKKDDVGFYRKVLYEIR